MDRRAEYTDSKYNRSYQDKGWYAIKARHRADWRRVCIINHINPTGHPKLIQRLINESVGINPDDGKYTTFNLFDNISKVGIEPKARGLNGYISGGYTFDFGNISYLMYFTELYVGHNNLIFTSNLSGEYRNDYNIDEMNATIKRFYELVGIAE